ncbi:MAG: N-6 DNA methylase [Phycisphaerales bacterium]
MARLARLVEMFERNREDYLHGRYSETQLRREYIDPFFKALGWDVDNTQGYAEAYKDVIHEDAIRIGSATKAPDYCFRIGGTRKFFVEAKAPTVNLKDNTEPAYQVRRYAWSAKLPLSVLTDFEEFAVYDCRQRPAPSDKASKGRVKYYRYTDYAEHWDEIESIFSREAVLKGSFDKYAVSEKRKKGTAEVDDAFLAEIEDWRDKLARNIALRNTELSNRQLNYAVQVTIDRIIFLRICEDRGIERYGELMALLNGTDLYPRLMSLFRKADDRYNSGLFHFQREKDRHEGPDELTPELVIDDKPLKEIIRSLYYPDSPYEFSVLPAEILGQVYEQFLGKVIVLTAGHHAKVEDKPEVKKAGGVFYTPSYIVDYIVKQTVGKLLEGATVTMGKRKPPKLDRPLRVLDPACGSGSFLLGAYQLLLDWYLDYYQKNDPKTWAATKEAPICQSGPLGWKLTTQERKRILLEHIYGVDIDTQAAEVTKLSLLLRVLEGEKNLVLFHNERALPDLSNNIKCGNSLIGPDFYKGQQLGIFDEEERFRVNAFDWQTEFPDIFSAGGFDAVIGNPPYIRMEAFKDFKDYLRSHYRCHEERSDIYAYFIEHALKVLRQQGRFGMIVSNKFLRAHYGKPLRDLIRESMNIERVVDFAGLPVFAGATVRTIVLLIRKSQEQIPHTIYSPPPLSEDFCSLVGGSQSVEQVADKSCYRVPGASLGRDVWSFGEPQAEDLLERLRLNNLRLHDYCTGQVCRGVVSGCTEAFIIDSSTKAAILRRNQEAQQIIKPVLNGRDIRRYRIESPDAYLIYTHHGINIADYPGVLDHLLPFKHRLQQRATKQQWYELQQPQFNFAKLMDGPKIIFPDIATTPRFAFDDSGCYGTNTAYFIPLNDMFLLGLLNSSVAKFYFTKTCAGLEGKRETYLRFFGQYMEGFPVRIVNLSDRCEKARHEHMIELVRAMLQFHTGLGAARTPNESESLERQIAATDAEIDRLVYELYGLTEEEIRIVEEATQG